MTRARVVAALFVYTLFLALLLPFGGEAWMGAFLVMRLVVIAGLVLFLRGEGRMPAVPIGPVIGVSAAVLFLVAYAVAIAPGTADEYAYRFQASAMLNGSLTAEAPPVPTGFIHHIQDESRWFGKYPPGWPVLLAPALAVGIDPIWNALLALAIVYATYRLAEHWFDRSTAALAVLLLLLSPMFLLNSAGWLSHPSCGALIALAFLLVAKRRPVPAFALLALAMVIRPLTGACALLVLGIVERRRPILPIAAAVSAAVLLGTYNYVMTGDALHSTYALYSGTASTREFTLSIDSFLNNLKSLTTRSVLITDVTSAPFLLLSALGAVVLERDRKRVAILVGFLGALVAGYLTQVEPSFSAIGERYYYEAMFAVAIAAARTWTLVSDRLHFDLRHVVAVATLLQIVPLLHYSVTLRTQLQPFAAMMGVYRDTTGVVFTRWSPVFETRDFNPNPANWRKARTFVLPDRGSSYQDIACKLGYREWKIVGWNAGFVQVLGRGSGCPSL